MARSIADGRHDTIDASPTTDDLATGSATHTRGGLLAQHAEVAVLRRLVVASIGGQLDQLVDQRRQLLGLAVEIVDQLPPRLGREVVATGAARRRWCAGWSAACAARARRPARVAAVGRRLRASAPSIPLNAVPSRPVSSRSADRHLDVEPTGDRDVVGRLR